MSFGFHRHTSDQLPPPAFPESPYDYIHTDHVAAIVGRRLDGAVGVAGLLRVVDERIAHRVLSESIF